jgi:cytochrome oxidase Cu insertion factor (SCO1/SenC/PrrC family)
LEEIAMAPFGATNTPDGSGERKFARQRRGPGPILFAVLGIAVLLIGAFAYLAVHHHDEQNGLSSVEATSIVGVSTSLANEMALSALPASSAPNFTLIDQNGHTLSLASFKGRAVVLEFMDPHCTDICPLVSQEFVDAYHDLGKATSRVAFVAVNVNQYHRKVAAMARFSNAHQLDAIPSWHFFTGSVHALKTVWSDYGIEVTAPNPNADIIHTSVAYFIDPNGQERYLAMPVDDHTAKGGAYLPSGSLTSWGRGIARVSSSLTH